MAKNNNLTDFLTDVADAIRAKKGTTDLINPQDFSAEIASIEGGGSDELPSAEWKDVNFFDYDGRIVYSYTSEEALALTEFPTPPDHTDEGLTFLGWTMDLATLQRPQTEQYGKCQADIGALYEPSDGRTRIYINVDENDYVVPMSLGFFTGETDTTAQIDWGDGTEESVTVTGSTTAGMLSRTHIYAAPGEYVIKVGGNALLGGYTQSTDSDGNTTTTYYSLCGNSAYQVTSIVRVHRVDIVAAQAGSYLLYGLARLRVVNCGTWSCGAYAFDSCRQLRHVTISGGFQTNTFYACNGLRSLACAEITGSASTLQCFYACVNLRRVIPYVCTNSGTFETVNLNYMFGNSGIRECFPLAAQQSAHFAPFDYCLNLRTIRIRFSTLAPYWPKVGGNHIAFERAIISDDGTTTVIGSTAQTYIFFYATRLRILDCRGLHAVPRVGRNFFPASIAEGFTIIVPDNLFDKFAVATVWSAYVDYMVKASEYVES